MARGEYPLPTRIVAAKLASPTWDRNPHLLTQTDPEAKVTSYLHKSLSLLHKTTYGNGGLDLTTLIDGLGNPFRTVDPNGTVVSSAFDQMGRWIARSTVTLADDVRPVNEAFAYDSLNRMTESTKDEETPVEYPLAPSGNREARDKTIAGLCVHT